MAWPKQAALAEQAIVVVDVEVIAALGKQPRDGGDLVAVFRQVRLDEGSRDEHGRGRPAVPADAASR